MVEPIWLSNDHTETKTNKEAKKLLVVMTCAHIEMTEHTVTSSTFIQMIEVAEAMTSLVEMTNYSIETVR